MLRKLFCCVAQSKHAPSPSSVRSPAPQVHKPRESEAADVVDTWPASLPIDLFPAPQVQNPRESEAADVVDTRAASLPIDLFLQILLRLEPTAVVCCAGVCKPWRRAIIANASILGRHLDHFHGPSLLLGVFRSLRFGAAAAWLERTPGPFQSALPSNDDCSKRRGRTIPANSLVPAAASVALPILLSSKDGFILLAARSTNSLCLCNPVTGFCTIIPAAAAGRHNKYTLLSGSSPCFSSDPAVLLLAVPRMTLDDHSNIFSLDEEPLAYQIFSTSGDRAWVWGPVVQCSSDVLVPDLFLRTDHRRMVVCRDAVYWLAGTRYNITCVFGLDIRTGWTWTTELPMQPNRTTPHPEPYTSILATFSDGRLSLIRTLEGPNMEVWVMSDNAQWSLHRTILVDVNNLLRQRFPTDSIPRSTHICLSAFCPRSRCVVATWYDQVLLIDVDSSGLLPRMRQIGIRQGVECCPYEIDSSSTCISKMQHF